MAGRFPLLSDEHVSGPLLQGLARRGWDVQRGIDVFGQRTDDEALFAHAAREGRVFVSNDEPAEAIAIKWLNEGRPFRGVVCWKQEHQRRMSIGDLIAAFEQLAVEEDPFRYPIVHLKPKP